MKELTVKELYTLDETIAKDIFEGVPIRGKCFRKSPGLLWNWEIHSAKRNMKNRERISGSPKQRK